MKIIRRVLTLAVMALCFAAAYQFGKNAEPMSVSLFRWTTPPAPTWLVLVATFAAGALLAVLLLGYQLVRLSLVSRRYRREVGTLETELHRLRNVPLAADGPAAAAATPGRRG